ncbi:CLUMA_CG020231, isoform A [Clunio marinus]|uniref:CLUMA_CG020231, isoform A n=1 Tax=Clunio marinus TaxID=568069 RepID=A0A1J1J4D0_9DIPT|nr:CLUMA_CG020231, isoform A [Clunio marinus]
MLKTEAQHQKKNKEKNAINTFMYRLKMNYQRLLFYRRHKNTQQSIVMFSFNPGLLTNTTKTKTTMTEKNVISGSLTK